MTDGELQRTIGRLEQAVTTLTHETAAMKRDLESVRETLQHARGGWRVLMLLGGASAGMGAAISTKIAQWWPIA